jgi:glycosyltransferase involved in cell wall biosynthesis
MITADKFPKVSVCIPTYNYGRFIPDAIESVLGQTFNNFELLVVDNCSSDNTREVVENYSRRDARVLYICNEVNVGMVGNWNRCLKHASGEYIKILCADDVLDPRCLELQVSELEKDPAVALVTCARQLTSADLLPTNELHYGVTYAVVEGADAIRTCFSHGNLIGEPTAVLFRRIAAERGFDPKFQQLIDLEMWFFLLQNGKMAFVPETLCLFRQHEQQGTANSIRTFSFIDDEFLLYRKYADRYLHDTFLEKHEYLLKILCRAWVMAQSASARISVLLKASQYYSLALFLAFLCCRWIKSVIKRIVVK